MCLARDTSNNDWSCAKKYKSAIQSCVDKEDTSTCIDTGIKFLECFKTSTRDHQLGITVGLNAKVFLDSSSIKTNRDVHFEYSIDPMTYSSDTHTYLSEDISGFVILVTGDNTVVKTERVASWKSMYQTPPAGKQVIYSDKDSIKLETDLEEVDARGFLYKLDEKKKEVAKEAPYIIPPKYVDLNRLYEEIDVQLVTANEEKVSGEHFLGIVAIHRPVKVNGQMKLKKVQGDVMKCRSCSSEYLEWVRQMTVT